MFRGHIRRSGTQRSVWHRRERKRRPLDPRQLTTGEPPRPVSVRRPPSEAEWLSGIPRIMIRCVGELANHRGIVFHLSPQAVVRKLRLFYCACCRLRWELLPVPVRGVVETVERYALGRGTVREFRAARRAVQTAAHGAVPRVRAAGIAGVDWSVVHTVRLAVAATDVHAGFWELAATDGSPVGTSEQIRLLHALFGNPFRPIAIPNRWRTPTVVALARTIRAERAFDLMPILGDALQEAGCENADVLHQCREPGNHVPGSWVVDRVLGTEVV